MQRMMMQIVASEKLSEQDGRFWPGSSTLDKYTGYWSELRSFSQDVQQEYSGSGSAGIKAATGRVGLNDLTVEKNVDVMSPFLMEYACSGEAIEAVIIDVWEDTPGKPPVRMSLIVGGGVNVSSYKVSGERYFAPALDNVYNLDVPSLQDGGRLSGVTRLQKPNYTVTSKEVFTIWFTTLYMRVSRPDVNGAVVEKSWDGGRNCPDAASLGRISELTFSPPASSDPDAPDPRYASGSSCRFYKGQADGSVPEHWS